MQDPYDPTDEFREIEQEMAELEAAGEQDSIRYKALKRKRDKPPSSLGGGGMARKVKNSLKRAGWQKRRQEYEEDDG